MGAHITLALGATGWDVGIGYLSRDRRARGMAQQLEAIGAQGPLMRGDIADAGDRERLHTHVRDFTGHLDALVLNAVGRPGGSGGPPSGACRSSDPQVALATLLLPELSPGGSIVFITSHWAHLYPDAGPFPHWYESIAAAKHESERALRAFALRRDEIRLMVVCAGVVTGTAVGDAALRRYRRFAAEQRAINNIVTAEQMGRAVARVIADRAVPSGHTEIVGAPLDALR